MEFKTKGIIELEYKIEWFREYLDTVVGYLENSCISTPNKSLRDENIRVHDHVRVIFNQFNMKFSKPITGEQTGLPKDES